MTPDTFPPLDGKLGKRVRKRLAPSKPASSRQASGDEFSGPVEAVSHSYVLAAYKGAVQDVKDAKSGRNTELNRAAYKIGRHLHVLDLEGRPVIDEEEAASKLRHACRVNGYLAKDGRGTVNKTIESGLSSGKADPAAVRVTAKPPAKGTPDAREQAVAAEVAKIEIREAAAKIARALKASERVPLSKRFLSVDELADMPRLESLIEGALYRDTLALLVGPSGVGKSFLALDWALSVATGRKWMNRKTRQGKAAYISAEGATGAAQRVDAWRLAWGVEIPADSFALLPEAVNLNDEGQVDELAAFVAERKFDLVIVDTLARASGGAEENSATAMGVIIASLERLREANPGACVVAVHHSGHNNERARGSSAIHAAMSTVLSVSGDASSFKLEVTKSKDTAEGVIEQLMLRPIEKAKSMVVGRRTSAGWASEAEELPARLEESLAHFTRAFSATGATKTEFRDVLMDSGTTRTSAYERIDALINSKRLALRGSRIELPPIPSTSTTKPKVSTK